MSSFPSRRLEVWRSSQAESIAPILGAFSFEVIKTVMVPQTLQFLCEAGQTLRAADVVDGFLAGMRFANASNPATSLYWKRFENAKELFSFEVESLSDAIRQLELHADINLTFSRVTYLADIGRGPELPLLIISRMAFARGVAFEVEERSEVAQSFQRGDFNLSEKARVAQQHYSTGMALLAGEDSVSGLIDAAFMQFYLSVEATLESHEKDAAVRRGEALFGAQFDDTLKKVVSHIYVARHRFFGHAHPKYLKGFLDADTAFDIAKQTLVARWLARRLLELEVGRPLVKREMRLYMDPRQSVGFYGDPSTLENIFALPR